MKKFSKFLWHNQLFLRNFFCISFYFGRSNRPPRTHPTGFTLIYLMLAVWLRTIIIIIVITIIIIEKGKNKINGWDKWLYCFSSIFSCLRRTQWNQFRVRNDQPNDCCLPSIYQYKHNNKIIFFCVYRSVIFGRPKSFAHWGSDVLINFLLRLLQSKLKFAWAFTVNREEETIYRSKWH